MGIFKTLWAAGAGFWPSVLHFKGINRKEKRTRTKKTLNGDLIHRWGKRSKNKINNSNKKKQKQKKSNNNQTNHQNSRKIFKFYHHSTTKHKRLLKQNNIKSKRNKTRKEKRADYKTNETNKGTQLSHSFQNLKYFLHSNLFSSLKPPLCLFILISHTHQNQATKFK